MKIKDPNTAPAAGSIERAIQANWTTTKNEFTYHSREHDQTERQQLKFVFVPLTHAKAKVGYYSRNSLSNGCKKGIDAEGGSLSPFLSIPRSYACRSLAAGTNPTFIASHMGLANARMVCEVYRKWIGELNQGQTNMLNNKFQTAKPPRRLEATEYLSIG